MTVSTTVVDHPHRLARGGGALPAGRYARVEVADTGAGMSAAEAARLFEPFFTTKGPAAGRGMTLAAAYGLVRQAGGTIESESGAGRGATFRIDLPVAEQ